MKYIIIITILLSLVSCDKYLDKPGDPTKKIPHTIPDVQLLLDNPLATGCTYIGTDEFFMTASRWRANRALDKNYYLTWITNKDLRHMNPAMWVTPYQSIFNANLSIEILNEIGSDAQNKNVWEQTMGAAYFQRAWTFLTVAWEFSNAWDEEKSKTDPGAVLDLHSDVRDKLSRSTVAATYSQIISDAEMAVKYLPMYPTHPTRPSKLAAYGLLARVYLSMRKYDQALLRSEQYLSELDALIDYNNPSEYVPSNGTTFFKLFNNEVIYHNITTSSGSLFSLNLMAIDTVLYNSYDEKDLRKTVFFDPYEVYQKFVGSYAGSELMTGICTDEMYLTRAECYARQGKIGKAMKDLNDLLVKRWKTGKFVPLSASTKEEALLIILQERKKELLFRGVRWMDIKRLNEEGANITIIRKTPDLTQTATLAPKSPRYAMQLPHEIVFNFGYQQNPID